MVNFAHVSWSWDFIGITPPEMERLLSNMNFSGYFQVSAVLFSGDVRGSAIATSTVRTSRGAGNRAKQRCKQGHLRNHLWKIHRWWVGFLRTWLLKSHGCFSKIPKIFLNWMVDRDGMNGFDMMKLHQGGACCHVICQCPFPSCSIFGPVSWFWIWGVADPTIYNCWPVSTTAW